MGYLKYYTLQDLYHERASCEKYIDKMKQKISGQQEKLKWIEKYLEEKKMIKCEKCKGSGMYLYSDTGTYWAEHNESLPKHERREMIVGSGFTKDVCNKCWGSGNLELIGVNPLKWLDTNHPKD